MTLTGSGENAHRGGYGQEWCTPTPGRLLRCHVRSSNGPGRSRCALCSGSLRMQSWVRVRVEGCEKVLAFSTRFAILWALLQLALTAFHKQP